MKDFSNLSPKQIDRLAQKNREASEQRLKEEQTKRGQSPKKPKKREVYVDRSEDPRFSGVSHQQLFREMSKPPFQE